MGESGRHHHGVYRTLIPCASFSVPVSSCMHFHLSVDARLHVCGIACACILTHILSRMCKCLPACTCFARPPALSDYFRECKQVVLASMKLRRCVMKEHGSPRVRAVYSRAFCVRGLRSCTGSCAPCFFQSCCCQVHVFTIQVHAFHELVQTQPLAGVVTWSKGVSRWGRCARAGHIS